MEDEKPQPQPQPQPFTQPSQRSTVSGCIAYAEELLATFPFAAATDGDGIHEQSSLSTGMALATSGDEFDVDTLHRRVEQTHSGRAQGLFRLDWRSICITTD